ncbi:MAG: hypothetical protein K6T99_10540 [Armatimonadetes bacterium]|nr:hypothetical protein [Armatimonadota bacterium]
MPAKYHIHTQPMPPRHKPIGKYGIVDWREDCSACHNCVKRECAYDVYDKERDRLVNALQYVDYLYECKGCLCCVQSCTKGLLTWETNPEYLKLGDEVWTPDIISSTWFQAETGRIPVSGAGYPGPFCGPGFDSILTDMSEIVRPTRDGIHGREYINTQVDIGRKLTALAFNPEGKLALKSPPIVDIPIPAIFGLLPWHKTSPQLLTAILDAAGKLGTYAFVDDSSLFVHDAAIPYVSGEFVPLEARLAVWPDSPDVVRRIEKAKSTNPEMIAIVSLCLNQNAVSRSLELAKAGIDVIHLLADWHGMTVNSDKPKHITHAVREVHLAFVEQGNRDEITIIAGGGIALAEHMAKTIICGADLVSVDVPLMVALECRICKNCQQGLPCPIEIEDVEHDYAVQRVVNLVGAWHNQLLEMMGAMGIREVRRLRGEVGRAMFFDDLERECFEPIFGKRKEL